MTLAQQLIDGSADGDVAFIAMTVFCVIFVWILFAIDKVNKGPDKE
jgi:hypothetical protein